MHHDEYVLIKLMDFGSLSRVITLSGFSYVFHSVAKKIDTISMTANKRVDMDDRKHPYKDMG